MIKRQWNKAFCTLMCWLYTLAYPAPGGEQAPAAPAGRKSAGGRRFATGQRPLAWWQVPAGRWAVLAVLFAMPEVASAGWLGGGTLPWMKPLGAIASSLDGPVARVGVLIAIAFFGLLMMFGELKGIFGTAARILFGASLALGAVQWAGVLNFGSANSAASYISSGAP